MAKSQNLNYLLYVYRNQLKRKERTPDCFYNKILITTELIRKGKKNESTMPLEDLAKMRRAIVYKKKMEETFNNFYRLKMERLRKKRQHKLKQAIRRKSKCKWCQLTQTTYQLFNQLKISDTDDAIKIKTDKTRNTTSSPQQSDQCAYRKRDSANLKSVAIKRHRHKFDPKSNAEQVPKAGGN